MKIKFGPVEKNFSNLTELMQFIQTELTRVDSELASFKKKVKQLKSYRRELAKSLSSETQEKEPKAKLICALGG